MTKELPAPGDEAPDFTAPTDGGGEFKLSALKGKLVVLYFYPKDDTSGCTAQACAFREAQAKFARAGAQIVGVSKDSVARHDKFKAKYGLPFSLVSDDNSTICEAYGVWKEKSMYGRKYMGVERSTFVIDAKGVIREGLAQGQGGWPCGRGAGCGRGIVVTLDGIAELAAAARAVLNQAAPAGKLALTRAAAQAWAAGELSVGGRAGAPDHPARPERPVLLAPGRMPRRRKGIGAANRIALLHALAHIELNAVDLAWDLIARFADAALPREFWSDWVAVAADEAPHFALIEARLGELGAAYGELPAHDGLWDAARAIGHDLLARLAVVPLVLEARGLDVTPAMIARENGGDKLVHGSGGISQPRAE